MHPATHRLAFEYLNSHYNHRDILGRFHLVRTPEMFQSKIMATCSKWVNATYKYKKYGGKSSCEILSTNKSPPEPN